MPPRARRLSDADKASWANYARLIAPLPGKIGVSPPDTRPIEPPPTPADLPPRVRVPPAVAKPRAKPPVLSVGEQPGGIDKATWQRFRTGKLVAVRKLDLHGMTAQHAFHALVAFLRTAHADQVRCVEVVTGRGSGETGGVIRREFPLWLNLPDVRPLILGAAHPHALNPGSVRLILRRIR
nr:Smr/MutS family protein [uncultured Rhodopila sp.]